MISFRMAAASATLYFFRCQWPGHADSASLKPWTLLFQVVIVLHRLAVEGEMDAVSLVERRTHLERWIDRLLNESVDGAGEMRIRRHDIRPPICLARL